MVADYDAFAPRDAQPLLADVTLVGASVAGVDALRALRVDVIVDLTRIADTRLSAAAKYGLWRFSHPYAASSYFADCAFWPIYHHWGVGEAALEEWSPDGTFRIVAQAHPATNQFSIKLSTAAFAWRMASLLARKLAELAEHGEVPAFSPSSIPRVSPSARAVQGRRSPQPSSAISAATSFVARVPHFRAVSRTSSGY